MLIKNGYDIVLPARWAGNKHVKETVGMKKNDVVDLGLHNETWLVNDGNMWQKGRFSQENMILMYVGDVRLDGENWINHGVVFEVSNFETTPSEAWVWCIC